MPDNIITLIEDCLERLIESGALVEPLKSAALYAVLPGGKRLRPRLAIQFCEDLGGTPEHLVIPACALELIHCASLVHDDLPAFDDDDFRRGKPSCHKAFNEATAVLVGDVLVPIAFSSISKANFDESTRNEFSSRLGSAFIAVCAGQQLDLLHSSERPDVSQIHRLKTGALFGAAFSFGALGAARRDICEEATYLGTVVGELFQVADDYLDLYNAEAKGRAAGSDARNSKITCFHGNRSKVSELLIEIQRKINATLEGIAKKNADNFKFSRTMALIDDIKNKLPADLFYL